MGLIPDRIFDLMTPEEQDRVRAFVRGQKLRSTRVECPKCGQAVCVEVRVDIAVQTDDMPDAPAVKPYIPPPAAQHLPTEYRDLVNAAKASGLFDQFTAAVREEKHEQTPKDLEAFFCRFWDSAVPVRLKGGQRDLVWTQYGQRAEAWGAHGVLVIVLDAMIRAFIPNRFIRASVAAGSRFRVDVAPQFDAWVKGPYGYVPESAQTFAAALRERSIGAFGRLVQ